jgi:hypothetical protein
MYSKRRGDGGEDGGDSGGMDDLYWYQVRSGLDGTGSYVSLLHSQGCRHWRGIFTL